MPPLLTHAENLAGSMLICREGIYVKANEVEQAEVTISE